MEALLFMIDSLAVVVLIFMGLRDDRRLPGTPAKSWFRMVEDETEAPPAAARDSRHEGLGF